MTDPVEVLDRYQALLADCRARLSAAERERDKALLQLHYVPDDWRHAGRLRAAEQERDEWRRLATEDDLLAAAEAGAEALEAALDAILGDGAPGDPLTPVQVRAIARAALAGREETGGG